MADFFSWQASVLRSASIALGAVLLCVTVVPAQGAVERYKNEAEYIDRLAELGYTALHEGFESSDWDEVRTVNLDFQSLPSVDSQGLTWESAGRDVWPYPFSTRVYGVTTNSNWARSGDWGIFEDHKGDPIPTTIRVHSPTPIYGIGGWFNTNPDGLDFGFLFEDATSAEDPGWFLPGYGAMYPGDNSGSGHNFAGLIFTEGFTDVVLTGVLRINEENQLEGGAIYGADDFTFAVPIDFVPEPTSLGLGILGFVSFTLFCAAKNRTVSSRFSVCGKKHRIER
ncbi:MAG: hypothetical protein RIC12_01255 [Pirellulales bacterium]